MKNSKATCEAQARQHTRQLLNSTASTEKLDRNSTARQTSTGRHMESASTGLDGARQELDRLDRQGLDNGLDSGSTEPRQLDSSTARAQTTTVCHARNIQSLKVIISRRRSLPPGTNPAPCSAVRDQRYPLDSLVTSRVRLLQVCSVPEQAS